MDYVIIVAGGKGLRMGGDVPKQFLPVGGKPILMRTIERFLEYDNKLNIVLVLPSEQFGYWISLCQEHKFNVPHSIVEGGETRFHSSRNGLNAILDNVEGTVAIHDAVRPFVSVDVISRCFEAAKRSGAAIPVMPVTDTLRLVRKGESGKNVVRSNYRIVQTPQVFDIQSIKRAFDQPYRDSFTDDASVAESMGQTVEMVEGNRENIKLTTPFDLVVAEALVKQNK